VVIQEINNHQEGHESSSKEDSRRSRSRRAVLQGEEEKSLGAQVGANPRASRHKKKGVKEGNKAFGLGGSTAATKLAGRGREAAARFV